jgi:hypothetical protein
VILVFLAATVFVTAQDGNSGTPDGHARRSRVTVRFFARNVDRAVIDQTGLADLFDIRL